MAQARPAGEVVYAFLQRSGWLRELVARADGGEAALASIARFFESIRRQSTYLADDRLPFVVGHLATLASGGDEQRLLAEPDDGDAVQVLTVHQAKGLEFGLVVVAGLAEGAFPASARRDPLALPDELGRRAAVGRDALSVHVAEERRLCFVAMTRARDELVLTNATDYGGRRARRVSTFVLEALDAPIARASVPPPLDRLAAFAPAEASPEAARPRARAVAHPRSALDLSFYQVDDYLTCPQKYRYVHVLRVPVAAHHSIVYGAALHRAIQEFHRRQQRGETMTEEALVAAFEAAWTSEGFLSRDHEDARLAAGRTALKRFRDAQLAPGGVIPTHVEEDFAFSLDGDRVRGRWDRVDVETPSGPAPGVGPGTALAPRVTITDYKSSDVRDPARAKARARESLQLAIYAMGWEAREGRLPDALQLHFLESGMTGTVTPDPKRLEAARDGIRRTAAGLRAGRFEATPDPIACGYCPFRDVCPASRAR
jgi:DNA helicase-2/ATP-dependent DNA helicase PcrA